MVRCLDEGVGNVTAALRAAPEPGTTTKTAATTRADGAPNDDAASSMWENTLLLFLSDNGGPVDGTTDHNGQCNFPLRGSKHTLWEVRSGRCGARHVRGRGKWSFPRRPGRMRHSRHVGRGRATSAEGSLLSPHQPRALDHHVISPTHEPRARPPRRQKRGSALASTRIARARRRATIDLRSAFGLRSAIDRRSSARAACARSRSSAAASPSGCRPRAAPRRG